MIQQPIEFAFFGIAGVIMAITALKPQWTVYVLTYGRPDRAKGRESGVAVMRVCAAIAAIGVVIALLAPAA
ncbi:MAG: hypothetical protein ABIO43_00030 [Sphingomicrobium sp.]